MNNINHLLDLPHINELLGHFAHHNIEARIVGGAVRDFLLKKQIHDIDIAAACPPKVMMDILKGVCTVVPTGLQHGTITAVFEKNVFQITSLREDIKTDGRHAEVIYGTSFEHDAARRDFTFNALYMDIDGDIYDYFGGKDDLKKGSVRFIGDAHQRITEDYLRILRFFRMYAYFGKGAFDEVAIEACALHKDGILKLSRERIRHEFFKILGSPQSLLTIKKMAEKDILETIADGADLNSFTKLCALEKSNDITPKAMRGLLTLFPSLEIITQSFVLTKKEQTLKSVLKKHRDSFFDTPTHALLYKLGKENFLDVLLINAAFNGKNIGDHMNALVNWKNPSFPLAAADLPHLSGRMLGDALKSAESYWLAQEFKPTKKDLIDFIVISTYTQ